MPSLNGPMSIAVAENGTKSPNISFLYLIAFIIYFWHLPEVYSYSLVIVKIFTN